MTILREAFYLDTSKGTRFCLLRRPVGAPCGAVLHVPPFAEEMNKSRRMVALAAERMASQGWAVLQIDLMGCGDSHGDFGEAEWGDWLDDLTLAHSWLQQHVVAAPPVLWSLRAGSLLLADWLRRTEALTAGLLMWQPVLNGRQHLTQFLRLKAANEMLADADASAVMSQVRAALAGGQGVEIAGYLLSPGLARGLEAASVSLPIGYRGPVALIELRAEAEVGPSPGVSVWGQKQVDAGLAPILRVVQGPAFWQTQEIELAPDLLACTDEVLGCLR